jgi:hypothetical protein
MILSAAKDHDVHIRGDDDVEDVLASILHHLGHLEQVGVEDEHQSGETLESIKELIHLAAVRNDIRVGEEESLQDVLSNVLRHLHQAAKASHGNCHCGKGEGNLSVGSLPDGTLAVFCQHCRTNHSEDEPVDMSFKGGQLPPLESHDPFDEDEDTTAADFEEAGRLTDSAVADAHADDAEDE